MESTSPRSLVSPSSQPDTVSPKIKKGRFPEASDSPLHSLTVVIRPNRNFEATPSPIAKVEDFDGSSAFSSSSSEASENDLTRSDSAISFEKTSSPIILPIRSSSLSSLDLGRVSKHSQEDYSTDNEQKSAFDDEHRTLVDTEEKLEAFLAVLPFIPESGLDLPQLALDSEGNNLGRFGSMTLLQLFLRFLQHTYLLDILTLGGRKAFDHKHENGWSVRRLLESDTLKIFWDPRQDQDSFWAHFGIKLGHTMCLQLAELVVRDRGRDREYRMKLVDCINLEGQAWMSTESLDTWVEANCHGRRYFQEFGYEVFEQRPIPSIALEYAAGDVDQMLQLWDHFYPRLTEEGKELVARESKKCLLESMLSDKPDGSAFAPQAIKDLPIVPFVFEKYIPQELDQDQEVADQAQDNNGDSGEQAEWAVESEDSSLDWERRALETVNHDWSASSAQRTSENTQDKMQGDNVNNPGAQN